MNVAIAVKEFPPDGVGGTETQTKRLASSLANHGHQVTVYTKRYREHNDESLPFDVVRCWNLRLSPVVSDLTFLLIATIALVRRSKRHDCLQCMMVYPMGFVGYLVRRFGGLPYFAWVRGNDFYVAKDVWWKRWMIERVLGDTTVLVQSSEIKADVREEFPHLDPELQVLGNGVTVPSESAPLTSNTVLYLGRLAPKKGVKYLLEAMTALETNDSELLIVGDGPERDRLEDLAAELDVPVRFEGSVEPAEVGRYYRRASVFVLPSTEGEGLPNAVLEAMSWGVPVVATDSGGLPTVVDDAENGFIVPMRSPGELSDRIDRLLSDQELRESIGAAGRETVQREYGWSKIITELEGVYDSIVKQ